VYGLRSFGSSPEALVAGTGGGGGMAQDFNLSVYRRCSFVNRSCCSALMLKFGIVSLLSVVVRVENREAGSKGATTMFVNGGGKKTEMA